MQFRGGDWGVLAKGGWKTCLGVYAFMCDVIPVLYKWMDESNGGVGLVWYKNWRGRRDGVNSETSGS